MADAASDTTTAENATTTDQGAAGAADTSTDTKGKAQSEDGSAASAGTDKADDQSGKEDGSDGGTGSEDAGGSASDSKDDKSQSTKEQNRKAMELRLAQKNEKSQELRQKLQTDYIDEAENDNDRRIREIETDRYIEKVERVNRDLARDNEQAAREIPLFNSGSSEFNKDLLDRSLKRYSRDCLTQDENGAIVAYSIPLLDYLREEAAMYGAAGSNASGDKPTQQEADAAKKAKAEQDQAKMDAAADATGGASAQAAEAKKTGNESFDDAFLAGMTDPYAPHKPRDAHTFSTAA